MSSLKLLSHFKHLLFHILFPNVEIVLRTLRYLITLVSQMQSWLLCYVTEIYFNFKYEYLRNIKLILWRSVELSIYYS